MSAVRLTTGRAAMGGRRIARAALGCAVACSLIAAGASSARASAVFSVQPTTALPHGYFTFASARGGIVRSAVEVLNIGDHTGSALVYAVDGTTGQTSGAVYRSSGEPRRDVGAWIRLAKRVVTLPPHSQQSISFAVRVPVSTFGGQHLGGIVVQAVTPPATPTIRRTKHAAYSITIRELSIVAVQVDLPGAQPPRLSLTGLRADGIPGHQSILIGVANPGNVLVKGRGILTVVDSSGRRVERQAFALDTLVSHTRINYPAYTPGRALGKGRYTGTVAITYGARRLVRSFRFTISSANQRQVFGAAPGTRGAPPSSSRSWPIVPFALAVAVAAAVLATMALSVGRLLRVRGAARPQA